MRAGDRLPGRPSGRLPDGQAPFEPWGDTGWIQPLWPAPAGVRALCTTRDGGVSEGVYASLNLGGHVGDLADHVDANRRRLQEAVGARPVFLQQVHGTVVAALDTATPDGRAADACETGERGLACTIMVADCMPVLFCNADGSRVGAAHAGWRGLAAGVLERTCDAIVLSPDGGPGATGPDDLIAWLGPCIGPGAFEVGPEVKAAFEAHLPEAAQCFRPGVREDKWMADLPALARQRLAAYGVRQVWGNDGSDAWCTVRNASRFFSHRRDGVSGRFAALVWRD